MTESLKSESAVQGTSSAAPSKPLGMKFDESDLPKKGSSHNGTETAWSVEGRCIGSEPGRFGGQLFDNRWRRVEFQRGDGFGVPDGPSFYVASRALRLYGYSAAQALRWWLHATADVDILGAFGLETRLVRHTIRCSYSEEEVQRTAYIGGEDRSNILPDWGTHAKPAKQRVPDGAEATRPNEQKASS